MIILKQRMLYLLLAIFCLHVVKANANSTTCSSEIAVANSEGAGKLGIIDTPPGGERDGVWFPVAPRALAIDSRGYIYIGDTVNHRVLKFTAKGQLTQEIKLQRQNDTTTSVSYAIKDMALDAENNLYIWNYAENRMEVYDASGRYVKTLNGVDNQIKKMFVKTPKGKYEGYSYQINAYKPDQHYPGRILYSITIRDKSGKSIARCDGIELAFDHDGLIYQIDYDGNVYTFDYYKTLNVIRIRPFAESKRQ